MTDFFSTVRMRINVTIFYIMKKKKSLSLRKKRLKTILQKVAASHKQSDSSKIRWKIPFYQYNNSTSITSHHSILPTQKLIVFFYYWMKSEGGEREGEGGREKISCTNIRTMLMLLLLCCDFFMSTYPTYPHYAIINF